MAQLGDLVGHECQAGVLPLVTEDLNNECPLKHGKTGRRVIAYL